MKKKWFLFSMAIIALLAIYFGLYYKNKELKYIPDSADAVVLIDVKNFTRKYLFETLTHPSAWFKDNKKKDKISWRDAGIKIPDFVQLFHLKNESFYNWNTVLEIKNKEEFLLFLKKNGFKNKRDNIYSNGNFSLKISGEICIIGTSEKNLSDIENSLQSTKNLINTDDFMTEGIGSLGIINNKKIEKYPITLEDNFIEISNFGDSKHATSFLSKNINSTEFATAQLDQKNIQFITKILKTDFLSHKKINAIEANVDLKQVTDTIVSYDYDDNFNEIEKISYQKIVQPQYFIQINTKNKEDLWTYFEQKKYINNQNQFNAIPFSPNKISKNETGILIHSDIHPKIKNNFKENFILIKNNPLILSSFKSVIASGQKKITDAAYLFYLNQDKKFFIRLAFKHQELPLILR